MCCQNQKLRAICVSIFTSFMSFMSFIVQSPGLPATAARAAGCFCDRSTRLATRCAAARAGASCGTSPRGAGRAELFRPGDGRSIAFARHNATSNQSSLKKTTTGTRWPPLIASRSQRGQSITVEEGRSIRDEVGEDRERALLMQSPHHAPAAEHRHPPRKAGQQHTLIGPKKSCPCISSHRRREAVSRIGRGMIGMARRQRRCSTS
jgi:hypothetical protein